MLYTCFVAVVVYATIVGVAFDVVVLKTVCIQIR